MTPINLGMIGGTGPDTPRTCRHTTSAAAYDSIKPSIPGKCLKVLECLKSRPATDEEVQTVLSMNPSTERPRRKELQDAGLVVDSGIRRCTASGRNAVVWAAA